MRAAALALLLLAAPVLTGCLGLGGDDSDGGDESVQKQQADVSSQTGGIQGVVTDTAVQPVEGANVTLVEADETTQTASDGSYAFSNLDPGSYTITVRAEGFISTSNETQVEANSAAQADFILSRVALQEAFMQQIEDSAFFECGVGVGVNLSAAGGPSTGVTWATCATLNLEGNTTNDDFSEDIEFEPPLTDLVVEAQWDPSSPAAEHMWLTADIQGFANLTGGNATLYQDVDAASPYRHVVNNTTLEAINDWFVKRCESGSSDGDRYCGYNFHDKGWPITARTFTATDCAPTPASGCAPIQQEVNYVFTAFYNQPAPDGYGVYSGSNATS